MEQALNILQDKFGYREFRGAQQDIIGEILAGNDALVLMPTGGGKSICATRSRPCCGPVPASLFHLLLP